MIAIINYGAGNIKSVQNAIKYLDKKYYIANIPEDLDRAETIILPGVGSAKPAMEKLKKSGFAEYLQKTEKSVIGICLGMQLMAEYSEEGDVKCLGVIPGKVKKFSKNLGIKIPHIGWNTVSPSLRGKKYKVFQGEFYSQKSDFSLPLSLREFPLKEGDKKLFYFVHSYYFNAQKENIFATCQYGIEFPAIVQHKNFIGIQFHPEKSGKTGLELLESLL